MRTVLFVVGTKGGLRSPRERHGARQRPHVLKPWLTDKTGQRIINPGDVMSFGLPLAMDLDTLVSRYKVACDYALDYSQHDLIR